MLTYARNVVMAARFIFDLALPFAAAGLILFFVNSFVGEEVGGASETAILFTATILVAAVFLAGILRFITKNMD